MLAALVRRLVDVVGAAALLAALAPALLLAMAVVRVASPGPALFRQPREGRGGTVFVLWKVRTMHVDAEAMLRAHLEADPAARAEWERYFRLERDPRLIPRVGRFLRRSSLDEVPQLCNVLRGEMSLVGPRPLPLDTLGALRPEYRALRNTVRPGLTGLWQVSGRSTTDVRALEELDAEYVRTRSLRGDLAILLRTPAAVWSGRGAY